MTIGLNVATGCTTMNLGVGVDVGKIKMKVFTGTINVSFSAGVKVTIGVCVGAFGVGVEDGVALGKIGVRVGGAGVAAGSLVAVTAGALTGAGVALATIFDAGLPPSAVGSDVTVARALAAAVVSKVAMTAEVAVTAGFASCPPVAIRNAPKLRPTNAATPMSAASAFGKPGLTANFVLCFANRRDTSAASCAAV